MASRGEYWSRARNMTEHDRRVLRLRYDEALDELRRFNSAPMLALITQHAEAIRGFIWDGI